MMSPFLRSFTAALLLVPLAALGQGAEARFEALENAREAYVSKLDELPSDEIREEFRFLGINVYMTESLAIRFAEPPLGARYADRPFADVDHYATPLEMAETYLASLMATQNQAFQTDAVQVEKPFQYPFSYTLDWSKLEFVNGETLAITSAEDPQKTTRQAFEDTFDIRIIHPEGARKLAPARLHGTATLQVPKAVHKLRFPAPLEGAVEDFGPYRVTITKRLPHHLEATLERQDGAPLDRSKIWLTVGAEDATGQNLALNGAMTNAMRNPEAYKRELLDALEKVSVQGLATNEVDTLLAPLKRTEDAAIVSRAYFDGTIASATIYLTENGARKELVRELDLAVTDTSTNGTRNAPLKPIPMPTPVIDTKLESLNDGTKDTFTEEEIRESLAIWQDRDRVRFSLPKRTSDLLFSPAGRLKRAGDLTFSTRFGFSIDTPHDDWEVYDIQIMRIDFNPEKFPATPRHVAGNLAFMILPEFSRTRHAAKTLPEGIRIEDNMLILTGRMRDREIKAFALTRDGRPLKRFLRREIWGDDIPAQTVHYYYGRPAMVEVLRKGEEKKVIYPISVPLKKVEPEAAFYQ